GNNEYADRDMFKTYSGSSIYSPVPDGATVMVYSPADANGGAMQTSYDPYSKISVGGSGGVIYNSSGTPVGEFGSKTINASIDTSGDLTSWSTVSLRNTYTNPVVIAKPPTFNGGDPSVVRIKDVSSTSFKMTMQEWDYRDGNHTNEDVSYIVMEAGSHTLPDGIDIKAGTLTIDEETVDGGTCRSSLADSLSVSFSGSFTTTPVVISSVTTFSGDESVASRVWNIGTSGFTAAIQEQQDPVTVGHNPETLSYIAFEPGALVDATNEWSLEVGSISGVTENKANVVFSSVPNGVPTFLAAMQTMSENDTAVLRLDGVSSTGATLHIEEELSCESDVSHTSEDVGYVALRGAAELNIALAVTEKPTGLLQDISDGVRLGVSFYRYNPDANDIYNQNVQGGTIRFKIPINPFVKKPSNTSLPAAEVGYTELDGYIGASIDDIVDAVNKYPLVWGTTPIAENLWEVIQYFEQDNPHYSDVVTGFADFDLADESNPERDPFYYPEYNTKLFCASPSVLIFTDGYPYKDADIPSEIRDYDEDSHSDDVADSDINAQGRDNLDDVAYWAFCDTTSGDCPSPGTPEDGTRDLRDDLAEDQYLTIYTVGFADGNIRQVLQDTADNAGGLAYAAEDGKALEESLKQAFTAAMSRSSFSSVALNTTGSITTDSELYLAVFDAENWTGDIEAYPINTDGTVADTPRWIASDHLPTHTNRVIITYDGSSGQPFQWDSLTGDQQTDLGTSEVLDYLRGDTSNELANGGAFRDRAGLLGDFVNSAPVWVGGPNFRYRDTGYSAFKQTYSSRTPVIYAGANDGMLHAFLAETGEELFAYVPAKIYEDLADLTDPDYTHQYYVDGSPMIVDAYFSSGWHTVLVGGYNAGGQGLYALDVTDPSSFDTETNAAANVLWEFDDSDDADLGYTFSQPNIVKLQGGAWAAVFGNGYNNTVSDGSVSATGNAVLFIVNLETGSVTKLDTGKGTVNDPTGDSRPNGLATVAPVDVNGDGKVDYVYGGDLFGNMWKFDLTSTDPASWALAFGGSPLYTACAAATCNSTNSQPITTRPQVGIHPSGKGYMVYFGTGKYIEHSDDSGIAQVTQSFYGIWDKDVATLTSFNRDALLQQVIVEEVNITSYGFDDWYRLSTDYTIDWSTHLGWYMDLINTQDGNTDNKGERQISNSILRDGKIIFTTLVPNEDPCSGGGYSWLMELDATDGTRLHYPPFDVTHDGDFNEDDYITPSVDMDGDGDIDADDRVQIPPSGKRSKEGIIASPGILTRPEEGDEFKYSPGTTGNIEVIRENPGPGATGRQSWRELEN
nr:PilC/PilY family type IV pilus protein [Gammaproteobacteria bacterium]